MPTRACAAPFSPVPKFLCIKAVLFMTFWQSVMIAGLVHFNLIHEIGTYTTTSVSRGLQNLLICFEMFIAAIAHRCVPLPPPAHTHSPRPHPAATLRLGMRSRTPLSAPWASAASPSCRTTLQQVRSARRVYERILQPQRSPHAMASFRRPGPRLQRRHACGRSHAVLHVVAGGGPRGAARHLW